MWDFVKNQVTENIDENIFNKSFSIAILIIKHCVYG